MNVTTAVIFAAGGGTRMLPVTSAVQKELLPVLNRPIIDYLVGDLIRAGVTRIIFVIRPDSHGLQDYYPAMRLRASIGAAWQTKSPR
jgi:UTP--glucose-1-phosphate uridylyltransferase